MFAYCNYFMPSGEFRENVFVRVLELTHPKSAVPRARVLYHAPEGDFEFYKPREKLIAAIELPSSVRFQLQNKAGFKYWIDARAAFFKHPAHQFTSEITPWFITEILLDGTPASIASIAEYTCIDETELKAVLHKQLLDFCDELPF